MLAKDRRTVVQIRDDGEHLRVKRVQPKVDLESCVKRIQEGVYPPDYFYRPVHLITIKSNLCDCHCVACNIRSTSNKAKGQELSDELVLGLMRQAYALGFIVYNGTFSAEPFDNMAFAEVVLEEFRGKMDCYAINTSGIRFTSEVEAERLFVRLKAAGWTATRYVLPFLSISIGMQQGTVPLKHVVYGISAFRSVFPEDEATLSVSYYKTNLLGVDTLGQLRALYHEMTKRELEEDVIVKTGAIKAAGRGERMKAEHFRRLPLEKWLSDTDCFKLAHFSYVDPVVIIESNGGIQPCTAGFGSPAHTHLGNVRDGVTLREAIDCVNRSLFFRTIAEGGTSKLFKRIVELDPEAGDLLRRTEFTNRHEACLRLAQVMEDLSTRRSFDLELSSQLVQKTGAA